ncbi:MAG TPA: 6-carboxytetrahydropterin synthase [Bacteroidales bacterium]|nr:6-carboxytetrahydropterin synthase [Bacteroidales bacterium]
MATIRITKIYDFEMAHVLKDYDGPCRNIHGHSYKLYVTVSGSPITDEKSPKMGMVMDFKDLKTVVKTHIVDRFDHALVINAKTDPDMISSMKKHMEKLIIVDYQPTSENLINDFAHIILKHLPPHVKLHNLRLWETATSYSEWFAEEN